MKYILTTLMLVIAIRISAQDLIVTNDADSINCKISKVKSDFIYFTFNDKGQAKNTLLSYSALKDYKYDFYTRAGVSEGMVLDNVNYQPVRFALNGGYSYRAGKLPEGLNNSETNYLQDLKSGYHLGADITYFFTEQGGLGFKYSMFRSSASINNTNYGSNPSYGEDNITIHYAGPEYTSRFYNRDKSNAFIINYSLGYLGYVNNGISEGRNLKITGATVGIAMDLGYDIGISEHFGIGFQFSYFIGTLKEIQLTENSYTETIKLESGMYESLNRFDFTIGLRFF